MAHQRILFLINNLGPGGAEGVFVNQANYLARKGYAVTMGLLRTSGMQHFKLDTSVQLRQFDSKHNFDMSALSRIAQTVRKEKISVVYATLDHAIITARFTKILCPQVRVVIRESGMADRKTSMIKGFDIAFNWLTDSILAVSDEVKKSLLSYQGIYAHKITTLQNGVYLPEISQREPHSIVTILHVGTMKNVNKGQKELIEIYTKLKQENLPTAVKLILVGDGKLKSELESFAREKGMENSVEFPGLLSSADLEQVYRQADIFVLHSKTEGLPNALLEAMSHGLPVVSTRAGGVGEVVEDGISGFLVEPGKDDIFYDKLSLLVRDQDMRISMGWAAYGRIRDHFSFDRTMEKFINIMRL